MRRKLTLATVVGARPQFIKCAPFSRLWRARHREILIHTGQHYSPGMSDVFFRELKIPKPDYHLGIGRGSHGEQTGRMLRQLDPLLDRLNPDGVLVYGDTNSTLAGALAAAKLKIPVFHVEAGMRSYRKDMPEEINRVLTDHVSDLLFVPTANAVHNLRKENIRKDVYQVGDIMLDAFRYFEKLTTRKSFRSPLRPPYALATIHRAENTDDANTLRSLCAALSQFPLPVLWPIHPRARYALRRHRIKLGSRVRMISPVGYLENIRLQSSASIILTDSGGMQKEAYFLHKPCITLRRETEWIETVQSGHNVLGGTSPASVLKAYAILQKRAYRSWPHLFGGGHTAERIASRIENHLS